MLDTRILWRTYAQVYDEVLHVIPYRNLLLELIDVAEIKTGMKLLDAGCGTGNLLWALKHQDIQCQVTGIDFSKDMLAKATVKLHEYYAPVELIHANLNEDLSTWGTTGPFDRVILNNSLWVLDNPTEVLQKVWEVSRDGAILVISTPRPNPNVNELLEEHLKLSEDAGLAREEALNRMLPRLQALIKCNESLMKLYGDDNHLPGEPQLRKWVTDAGWKVLDLSTVYAGQNWLVSGVKVAST